MLGFSGECGRVCTPLENFSSAWKIFRPPRKIYSPQRKQMVKHKVIQKTSIRWNWLRFWKVGAWVYMTRLRLCCFFFMIFTIENLFLVHSGIVWKDKNVMTGIKSMDISILPETFNLNFYRYITLVTEVHDAYGHRKFFVFPLWKTWRNFVRKQSFHVYLAWLKADNMFTAAS